MRRWWLAVALLLSLGVNVGLVSVAVVRRMAMARWEHGPAGGPPAPDLVGRRFAEELRLPPAKRGPFLAAQRRLAERTFEGRHELFRLRDELRREVAAPSPDRRKIDELVERLGRTQADLDRAFVEGMLETREVLGPDEFAGYLRLVDSVLAERRGPPPGAPFRFGRRFP